MVWKMYGSAPRKAAWQAFGARYRRALATELENFKQLVRIFLAHVGLLDVVRTLRVFLQFGPRGVRHLRLVEARPARAQTFVRQYGETFKNLHVENPTSTGNFLMIGGSSSSRLEVGLCLAGALQLAGLKPLRVRGASESSTTFTVNTYYSLLNSQIDVIWDNYLRIDAFRDKAAALMERVKSTEDLLSLRSGAVRIGGHAVSTARRQLAIGYLDTNQQHIKAKLLESLAISLASAEAIEKIICEFQPSFVLTEDTAYTPSAEILDVCVRAGVPVIRWYTSHKTSALMLKRYTSANRDQDLNSLSDASWKTVQNMDWNIERRTRLKRELSIGYARKDWYSEDGAQYNKRGLDAVAVRKRLSLDPHKKTAMIFPHIAYDASFGRGDDLFANYDEWLIETVRAACANDKLQWIVKIHPGHVGKRNWYGRRMPDEEDTIRMRIGRLPPHVSIIPAGSDISTLSLFQIMDYCLTVRGTVGIEAACRGIPVLTGGTGRYDRKGFTLDSKTPREYLEKIVNLQNIPSPSSAQVELAERFAYGLFLLRPLPLSSITMVYDKETNVENLLAGPVEIKLRNLADWQSAPDFQAFVEWAITSSTEDFLIQPDHPFG
jgi:hypothetical protein